MATTEKNNRSEPTLQSYREQGSDTVHHGCNGPRARPVVSAVCPSRRASWLRSSKDSFNAGTKKEMGAAWSFRTLPAPALSSAGRLRQIRGATTAAGTTTGKTSLRRSPVLQRKSWTRLSRRDTCRNIGAMVRANGATPSARCLGCAAGALWKLAAPREGVPQANPGGNAGDACVDPTHVEAFVENDVGLIEITYTQERYPSCPWDLPREIAAADISLVTANGSDSAIRSQTKRNRAAPEPLKKPTLSLEPTGTTVPRLDITKNPPESMEYRVRLTWGSGGDITFIEGAQIKLRTDNGTLEPQSGFVTTNANGEAIFRLTTRNGQLRRDDLTDNNNPGIQTVVKLAPMEQWPKAQGCGAPRRSAAQAGARAMLLRARGRDTGLMSIGGLPPPPDL